MSENKTKEQTQDYKDWCNLFEYVKKEILQYDETMKMPKYMILRLKGLSEGKFMANKNQKAEANYSFKVILLTFKMCKAKINTYIFKNKNSFTNEQHKFNGVMIIIENEINNTVNILKNSKKSEDKTKSLELKHQVNNTAKYETKGSKNNNKKLQHLW